jgi:hypothetical protein
MRPSWRELMVSMACTGATAGGRPNTIEPFAHYLDHGGELTPFFRQWLLALLRDDGRQPNYLIFRRRVGRPRSSSAADLPRPSDDDLAIWSACTVAGGNIHPLLSHLEAGGALTPFLRKWVVAMLRLEESQSHILQYHTRWKTSQEEVFSDVELEGRYWELKTFTVTDEWCQSLPQRILHSCPWLRTDPLMQSGSLEERGRRRIYRFGFERDGPWREKWVPPILTIVVGKVLSDRQIVKLLSIEFNISESAVKRRIHEHEQARLIR